MKYYYQKQVGTVYWLDGGSLMFTPMCNDGTFDTEEGGEVELGLQYEHVNFDTKLCLGDIWAMARYHLNPSEVLGGESITEPPITCNKCMVRGTDECQCDKETKL